MNNFSKLCFAVLASTASNSSSAAEYKSGWTPENFYLEVAECKKAIVFPAASNYIKRGQEKKHPEETLRNEAISMVPTFETFATKVCYCAVNEFAKDMQYGTKLGSEIQSYMQTPRCKAEIASTMDAFKQNPKALQLR